MLAEKIFSAKKNIDKTKKLSQITIDVSGFSRGAAAARNFVYEVNNPRLRIRKWEVKILGLIP